ncbi:alpha/beta fold hydrolase [Xenophilus sp. Marseille-Q4582]|uniref:alpha/beta fold hydrolase n=1 Tax=Xenophilus sp. Marseille-Q4582 TaxID=2866600 RepID=UPI001CE46760|nr:alpha/beta hydrolase [Xenophilus sp. Marseille-Q4582]
MTSLIDIGDCRIACTVTGTGPPLLLMHGAEGNHHMFDALVEHLAADFTVIAYDQRDCGDTRNPERATSLNELAQDAAALLETLGHTKAHVYGTSFGGRVAQALAHERPQVVDRLVLGSTWALPSALAALNPDAVQEIQRLRANLPDSAEALAGFFLPQDFLDIRPELKDLFRHVQAQSPRSIRRQAAVAECPPLEPGRLRTQTLVLAGELDRVVPPALTVALGQAIPGARVVLLPGVGHAAAVQAADQVAAHIRDFCLASSISASKA